MSEIKSFVSKFKDMFSVIKNKKNVLIVLLGFIGIFLIFISEIIPEKEKEIIKTPSDLPSGFELELEKRLEEAVSQISGAGKTDITITLDSSKEYFYAKNSSENTGDSETEKESELVILESAEGEEPIVLKTDEAKIRGVLVVCEGGNDPLVCEKILEAICALLDIPSNKVSVAKMA